MARVMAFVDGENLLLRFEQMKKDGMEPRVIAPQGSLQRPITHVPGKFVWSPHTVT